MGLDLETWLDDEGLKRQKFKKEEKKKPDVYTEKLGQVGWAHSDGMGPTIPRAQSPQ